VAGAALDPGKGGMVGASLMGMTTLLAGCELLIAPRMRS
jgi:hypothetical protein